MNRSMFPERLDSTVAFDVARAMMDGFNRHYRLFRAESARAKHRFETADWHGYGASMAASAAPAPASTSAA